MSTVEERFWAKVDKAGPVPDERPDLGPCWDWVGAHDGHGYANFASSPRRTSGGHRFSFELANGAIPAGLQLDHLCRNRGCVNPSHMEPVAQKTNVLRGVSTSAMNARKVTCPYGHEYTNRRSRPGRYCLACTREHTKNMRLSRVLGVPVETFAESGQERAE